MSILKKIVNFVWRNFWAFVLFNLMCIFAKEPSVFGAVVLVFYTMIYIMIFLGEYLVDRPVEMAVKIGLIVGSLMPGVLYLTVKYVTSREPAASLIMFLFSIILFFVALKIKNLWNVFSATR